MQRRYLLATIWVRGWAIAGQAPRLLLAGAAMLGGSAFAQHAGHQHQAKTVETTQHIKRAVVRYSLPDIELTRHDGRPVNLKEELAQPGPIFVNFIFTSCTTVCPVMTQIFSRLQSQLGKDRARVRLLSISIDPQQDTPARLAAYRSQFGAGAAWDFLTGTVEASVAAQMAFDVYRGDKMNHPVASFFRSGPDRPWVRIEGFATAEQLLGELHQ